MVLCGSEDAKSENDGLVYAPKSCPEGFLTARLSSHLAKEKVSFHTPGHKGRFGKPSLLTDQGQSLRFDLTELPGLDDLANPTGPLLDLETRIAQVFGASGSLISCNGASAAIVATMLFLAQRGTKVLVPRNCHRSLVNGLVLSGLQPIWYEPVWEHEWGIWGAAELASLEAAIEQESANDLAGIWLVSPTYAGALSDISSIAGICHAFNVPLIVDEAHGAHLLTKRTAHLSALPNGADIVVHSFHKHLAALTQTGALHLGFNGADQFGFSKDELRAHLNQTQSTSPSYLLLKSIDEMAAALLDGNALTALEDVAAVALKLRNELSSHYGIALYDPQSNLSPFHILLRFCGRPIGHVQEALCDGGIFAEAVLGDGILLMFGIGSTDADTLALKELLATNSANDHAQNSIENAYSYPRPNAIAQALAPREAFFAPHKRISKERAIGMVAAECVAPCPPGWPVVVPGQIIGEEDVKNLNLSSLRVVVPSSRISRSNSPC
jgi:arginine/lysine/ornithine decarboxylase